MTGNTNHISIITLNVNDLNSLIKYKRLTEQITPRHIIIKMPNIQNKDRILKAVREKHQITYRGRPIRMAANFSTQTLKARRACTNIFQALKKYGC